MKASFDAMNIQFESRNVALGNNPCVPYDVCIKYFAGLDADIVHWEQNYFCDGRSAMETFVRQAMTIPTRPIVVFSESNTGHWQHDKCKTGPHVLTEAEKKLLGMTPVELVSEGNKDEYHRAVRSLLCIIALLLLFLKNDPFYSLYACGLFRSGDLFPGFLNYIMVQLFKHFSTKNILIMHA